MSDQIYLNIRSIVIWKFFHIGFNKKCGEALKRWSHCFRLKKGLTSTFHCKQFITKSLSYCRSDELFDSIYKPEAEISAEAIQTTASIKNAGTDFSTLFSRKSLPHGVTLVIYVNNSLTQFFLVKKFGFTRLTEFHHLRLADNCPSVFCWRSFHVLQDTWISWTACGAVWDQNGCIPVLEGPQQD
jgi:hypothetical protein